MKGPELRGPCRPLSASSLARQSQNPRSGLLTAWRVEEARGETLEELYFENKVFENHMCLFLVIKIVHTACRKLGKK